MDFKSITFLGFLIACVGAEIHQSTSCTSSSIPGTRLQTRTPYTLSLKSRPDRVITWTQEGTPTWNNLEVDNSPAHLAKYKPGGEWYNHTLWEIIPTKISDKDDDAGWYALRILSRPSAYLTFGLEESTFIDKDKEAFHAIIQENYPAGRDKSDFLWKLVFRGKDDEGQAYHQLKSKTWWKGVITLSAKPYRGDGSSYVQLDLGEEDQYKAGGELYDDTRIAFRPVQGAAANSEVGPCPELQ